MKGREGSSIRKERIMRKLQEGKEMGGLLERKEGEQRKEGKRVG